MTDSALGARQKVFADVKRSIMQQQTALKAAVTAQYQSVHASLAPRPVVDGILIERLIQKHTAVHGTVAVVSALSEVPDAVSAFLSIHGLPAKMVMSSTEWMLGLDWNPDWEMECRRTSAEDAAAVTDVVCAVAESGTFVIASSADVSSTQMFLPENHVVIVDAGQIVRHLDDALTVCAERIAASARGVHMITGPSKTADVEQTLQYGAHGPRRLHAVIVDSAQVPPAARDWQAAV